jgi:hypothetical protein
MVFRFQAPAFTPHQTDTQVVKLQCRFLQINTEQVKKCMHMQHSTFSSIRRNTSIHGNMGGGTSAPRTNFEDPNPNRDTEITEGADWGAGRDSSILPMPPQAQDETAKLIMALASRFPDPDITRLAQRLKAEGRA